MKTKIAQFWLRMQTDLFPFLKNTVGALTEKEKQLAAILEMTRVEEYLTPRWWSLGRPSQDRRILARSFVVKTFYNLGSTVELINLLRSAENVRLLCGWGNNAQIPSESTFSRAFQEFALSGLPGHVHEALIGEYESSRLVGHLSRDSSDIVAREKPLAKSKPPRPKGRPGKGDCAPAEAGRLERQPTMTLAEMLSELPSACDWGCKHKNGRSYFWKGYKLHVDWADGEIPISCLLTSASLHDSQAAIPLATLSAGRVVSLYDLMDSAYDAAIIKQHSLSLGHVPIIDSNPRRGQALEMEPARKRRYAERSTAERGNSLLKECYGGRLIRVRGHAKVLAHLMFGMLVLTAERLMGLAT